MQASAPPLYMATVELTDRREGLSVRPAGKSLCSPVSILKLQLPDPAIGGGGASTFKMRQMRFITGGAADEKR